MTCGVIFGAKVLSASVAPLWIGLLLKIKFPSVGSDIIQTGTPLERINNRSSLVAIFFFNQSLAIVFRIKKHHFFFK